MASLYSDGSGSKLDQLYSDGGGSKIGQLYSSDPRGADGGLAADSREVKNRALEIKKAQRAGRRAYRLAMKSDNPAMAMQAREWAMEGKVPAGFSQAGRLAPAVANQANRTSALVNGQTGPVVQTPGRPPIGTRYADGSVEVGPSQAEAGNSTAGASREQQVDANGNARSMSLSEQAAAAAQKSQESGAFGTPTRFTFEKPASPAASVAPAVPVEQPLMPAGGFTPEQLAAQKRNAGGIPLATRLAQLNELFDAYRANNPLPSPAGQSPAAPTTPSRIMSDLALNPAAITQANQVFGGEVPDVGDTGFNPGVVNPSARSTPTVRFIPAMPPSTLQSLLDPQAEQARRDRASQARDAKIKAQKARGEGTIPSWMEGSYAGRLLQLLQTPAL